MLAAHPLLKAAAEAWARRGEPKAVTIGPAQSLTYALLFAGHALGETPIVRPLGRSTGT